MTLKWENPLLKPGHTPLLTDIAVALPRSTFDDICEFSNLFFSVGEQIIRLYFGGDRSVKYFVEYGLPAVFVDLLHLSRDVPPHKTLCRFDFFLTPHGPKLVEVSSNPWGLLTYQRHTREHQSPAGPFPGMEIYVSLCRQLSRRRIGFWRHFGVFDELGELVLGLERQGLAAGMVRPDSDLSGFDAIFYDIETAYFDDTLPLLLPHARQLLPSPANEIIKRKNLLPLMYLISNNQLSIPVSISSTEKELMRSFLVPTYLIDDEISVNARNGAIKEIVGIWGLQVTILSPCTSCASGSHARRRRRDFRRSQQRCGITRNAILQQYISPSALPAGLNLFCEFSVVYQLDSAFPFARIYQGTPEDKTNVGLGLVDITADSVA